MHVLKTHFLKQLIQTSPKTIYIHTPKYTIIINFFKLPKGKKNFNFLNSRTLTRGKNHIHLDLILL